MKFQKGRSMIEMLAVLAVIGALTIGGVWGYRKAVTKYLANHIIDDVNLSGFLILDELFHSLPNDDVGLDLTGRFEQKSPYTFRAFAETSTSFEIVVSGVPYPVCQELKDRDIKDIEEIRANGLVDECLSSGDNEMSFFFDTDPTAGTPCETDADCPTACGKCNSNNRCRNECEVIPDSCTSNDDCVDSGVCAGCVIPDGQETGTCQYACTKASYLESTEGTERIDTNWHIDWDNDVYISGKFSYPNKSYRYIIIGSCCNPNEFNIESLYGKFRVFVNGGGITPGWDGYQAVYYSMPVNSPIYFTYKYNSKTGKHIYSADDERGTEELLLSGKSVNTERLFGDNREQTWGTMKIYDIRIKNGQMQMDLVPVLDPDGEPAMLDRINQALYYNTGSGTFITDKD